MVAPAKAGKFTFYWAASQGLAAERRARPASYCKAFEVFVSRELLPAIFFSKKEYRNKIQNPTDAKAIFYYFFKYFFIGITKIIGNN